MEFHRRHNLVENLALARQTIAQLEAELREEEIEEEVLKATVRQLRATIVELEKELKNQGNSGPTMRLNIVRIQRRNETWH